MVRFVELTPPDGKPVLITPEAVTLVQAPNAAMWSHKAANALLTVAGQVAVTESVAR